MTKEDILRLRDTAEQTRVQFKERVTRDNKYDVSCEMVAQSNSRGGMIVVGIDGTRGRIATFLNTEVCMTNWYIGKRIKEDVLFRCFFINWWMRAYLSHVAGIEIALTN